MRELDRAEWTKLCEDICGEEVDARCEAMIKSDGADLEFVWDYGNSDISAYVAKDATDVRVGKVQLLVGQRGAQAALVISHPPYPIERWTVLWEGKLP